MIERTATLPFRRPLHPDSLYGHIAATGTPGVEEWRDGTYRRTLDLPGGPGFAALRHGPEAVACRLLLSDPADEAAAIARCRFLLDLDADPEANDAHLAADALLDPLVAAAPGRRIPRCVDPAEMAVRAVLGQQVSTAAARTHAARLVAAHGEPVADPEGGLTHLFPTPRALTGLDPEALALPRTRRATLIGLVAALAEGAVDLAAPDARGQLLALEGIGPWTVEIVAMRGLGDPDAFPAADLGVAAAGERLGLTRAGLPDVAERWRPYRSYAVQHLWATGEHVVNEMPA